MDPGKLDFLGWIPGRWGFQNGSPKLKNGSLEVVSPFGNDCTSFCNAMSECPPGGAINKYIQGSQVARQISSSGRVCKKLLIKLVCCHTIRTRKYRELRQDDPYASVDILAGNGFPAGAVR
jgi:hypothetical protein